MKRKVSGSSNRAPGRGRGTRPRHGASVRPIAVRTTPSASTSSSTTRHVTCPRCHLHRSVSTVSCALRPRYLTNEHTLETIPNGTSSPSSHRWIHIRDSNKIQSVVNPSSPSLMARVDICPRRFIDTHTLELVEFSKNVDTIPPYAILSHRWISGEEIVYQEYLRDYHSHLDNETKSGYRKIQNACRMARQEDLRYIWIDTCCIKQGDKRDVGSNITSMYGYYQNAEVCYAYLVDVSGSGELFPEKEWFRRGWTLQELLAPRTVVFLDNNWNRIGDKHTLQNEIHLATQIPQKVLSGEQSIRDIDVLNRMLWTLNRTTTKPQDGAYCLQGLLGVSIQPDYKEDDQMSFMINRLGKALLDANPELKGRLGIEHDCFYEPGFSFLTLVWRTLSQFPYQGMKRYRWLG
ncbi:HET-domain-containing protein [Dendrothele bispora CBS 962.96]|uniref:HET-domain-containing protein n=1 Tax=Dendrothele bispora (strain CBS 962.96) TaxID=1314807 RepID=A0A4S8MJD9_DENBC|nr:HET-domain-containing protein [Dendrothele bispora CBS 962.96]